MGFFVRLATEKSAFYYSRVGGMMIKALWKRGNEERKGEGKDRRRNGRRRKTDGTLNFG